MKIYETVGHRRRSAEVHWQLGDIEERAERWREAQRHYWTSVSAYGVAGHARGAMQVLGSFIQALLSRASAAAVQAVGEVVLALFPDDAGAGGETDADRASTRWFHHAPRS